MKLGELQKNWNQLGMSDPMWAVLTFPGKENNQWEPDAFFETGRVEVAGLLRRAEALGMPKLRRTALDFGCGVGRLTQALADQFAHSTGVDIAPSMIAAARRLNRHGDRCVYQVNDTEDLSRFPAGGMDMVLSRIVLQHMRPEYSMKYMGEFVRVLAPGGLAVFQIPSRPSGENVIKPTDVPVGEPLPDEAFRAQMVPDKTVQTAAAGSQITLTVRVRNISSVTWPGWERCGGYPLQLGIHWLDKDGRVLVNDDARVPVRTDLAPGERVDLPLTFLSPAKAGEYILELDMVQELVSWFQGKGSSTCRMPVRIEPSGAVQEVSPSPFEDTPIVPRMEMYGIPRAEVVQLVADRGGSVLEVEEDDLAPGWESFTYYVTKT
jgi:SAM-dependent methyltransferase